MKTDRRRSRVSNVYALEDLTLAEVLRQKAVTHRDETFLRFRDGALTFGEVEERAARLARGLAESGVRQGDHVAVMLPNCADFLDVIFALARLGAVAVPINTSYKGDLLRHVLVTSDATMLVLDEPYVERFARVEADVPDLRSVVARAEGSVTTSLRAPTRRLADLYAGANAIAAGDAPRAEVRFGDLQAIMYTSGTTGPSKGVMVPHALALTCALDSLRFMAHQPDETIYCPLPLFHAAGLWDGMMMALLAGSPIAVVERFSASRFWDDVRTFGATQAMGVFDMIPILLNQPRAAGDRDHTLRRFYMGKSALDGPLFERFGVHAIETYTSTEAGIGTASPYGEWRPGSCGQANGERFEVTVVDEEDRELPPGEPGEIVLRPKQPFVLTTGYYNVPEVTARTFRNLWFHTGDRATRDDDGYFFFVDRIKDSIRRRGENISAFEVEQTVNAHPAVLESAAFGVPSELEEEELEVAVALRPGAELDPEELVTFCDERLPRFMVPRYVEVLDELPRTATGKIAKHLLRTEAGGRTATTWDRKR
jgi:crotonobetaine/carnitine-CoA ligase